MNNTSVTCSKRKSLRLLALLMALLCLVSCAQSSEITDATDEVEPIEYLNESPKLTVSLSSAAVTAGAKGIELPNRISNEYLSPILSRLNEASYACAMYYVDLETGLSITYNEDRFFAGASLIKAEYMMSVFEMIQNAQLSYDDLYTYTKANKRGGTSEIPKEKNFGAQLTLKEIIEYLIYHSDNTAYNMLLSYVRSYDSFTDWAEDRYGTTFYFKGCNWLNAVGVAECWKEIYERYKAGDEDYLWYVSLLKVANENKFVKGGLPKDSNGKSLYEVAHKYGMDISASNDAAIVFYEDRPYLLIILTDYIGYNTQYFMNRISEDVFALHEYICSADED